MPKNAGYLALSPGLVHIPVEFADQTGYQWGLRGGVELGCGGPCAIALGASFQHSVGNSIRSSGLSSSSHQLRAQAEVMPGARLIDGKLFVFGDVGIGYVAWPSRIEINGDVTRDVQHGVAFSIGAGASYLVWRQLFVGGRFGGDLQWFFVGGNSAGAHNLALEAFVGWRFGLGAG